MRKIIITVCVAGAAIIILQQFGFFEALMMFLLAGVIPGTTYSLPSSFMYALLLGAISLTIVRFIGASVLGFFYHQAAKYLPAEPKKNNKKHLPKRRYSQI